MLEGSGVAYLPSEAQIIACGSINKFLKQKPYNHCRCGNLLLAAMHGLHLERFIEDINIPSTNLLQELENWENGEDMSEVPRKLSASSPAHLFAIRGKRKRGPGILQTLNYGIRGRRY